MKQRIFPIRLKNCFWIMSVEARKLIDSIVKDPEYSGLYKRIEEQIMSFALTICEEVPVVSGFELIADQDESGFWCFELLLITHLSYETVGHYDMVVMTLFNELQISLPNNVDFTFNFEYEN